jgi:hypothetical protein
MGKFQLKKVKNTPIICLFIEGKSLIYVLLSLTRERFIVRRLDREDFNAKLNFVSNISKISSKFLLMKALASRKMVTKIEILLSIISF